ncbi:MAG: hypothetical protein ACRENP_05445 [Longimicrobiales bacterium]
MLRFRLRNIVLLMMCLSAAAIGGCVEESAPNRDLLPVWSITKDLEIGDAGIESTLLTRVAGLYVTPTHDIVVAQPQEYHFKVFNSSGRLIRTIGSRGQGPTEFREIVASGVLGDTLWANDLGKRMHYAVISDAHHMSVPLVPKALPRPYVATPVRRLAAGWSLVAASVMLSSIMASGELRTAPVYLLDPNGVRADSVRNSLGEYSAFTLPNGELIYVRNPLSARASFAVAQDGQSILELEQRRPNAVATDSFAIRRYSFKGELLQSAAIPYSPIAVQPHEHAPAIEQAAKVLSREVGGLEIARRGVKESIGFPKYHLPIRQIVTSINGDVWLQRFPETEGWLVLGPDLREQARAYFPPGFQFMAATRDFVIGTSLDAFDVPTIIRFRIQRGDVP